MKISEKKREKILEQILSFLYQSNLKPMFTSQIAQEIARDEEFVKALLLELKEKKFVVEIKKNPKGDQYIRRSRWVISDIVYQTYKNHQ